jgi:hypothetical protein
MFVGDAADPFDRLKPFDVHPLGHRLGAAAIVLCGGASSRPTDPR